MSTTIIIKNLTQRLGKVAAVSNVRLTVEPGTLNVYDKESGCLLSSANGGPRYRATTKTLCLKGGKERRNHTPELLLHDQLHFQQKENE